MPLLSVDDIRAIHSQLCAPEIIYKQGVSELEITALFHEPATTTAGLGFTESLYDRGADQTEILVDLVQEDFVNNGFDEPKPGDFVIRNPGTTEEQLWRVVLNIPVAVAPIYRVKVTTGITIMGGFENV